MPTFDEIQLVQPRNFTIGSDIYKGLTDIQPRKNAPVTMAVLKEDDITPSAYHQMQNDQPAVQLTVSSKSYQVLTQLAGTSAAQATYTATEAGTSNQYVVTLTNPVFEGSSGSIQQNRVGGFSLGLKATAIDIDPV